jgi:hypothetical protein
MEGWALARPMRLVEVRLQRAFRHAPDAAYGWLTDFRADDGAIAGALIEGRDRVAREGDVVRMATRIKRPLGSVRVREQEVRLFPRERRWESRIVAGYGQGSLHRYQVVPAPEGSALEVRYGFAAASPMRAALLRAGRPLLARQLHRMWDGFEAAMDRDLVPRAR